jgi:large repetitive protein
MPIRRSTVIKATAVTAVLATLTTVAIIAEGFDVAQTPVNDSAVWALQAGDGNRYARINTELGELDTVKDVQNPSELVQSASVAMLLMERNGRITDLDAGRPQNYTAESEDIGETPTGTNTVTANDTFIAYLTDNGRIFASRIDEGAEATVTAVDPYADENAQPGATPRLFAADSVAIGADSVLYAYSVSEGSVMRFSLTGGNLLGFDEVAGAPEEDGTSITAVGGTWVLLSADGSSLWISGREPVDTGLADDAVLQQPSSTGSRVYIASRDGLDSFALSTGAGESEVDGANGIPAAPTALGTVVYAAWLDENSDAGLLWSSTDGEAALDYGGESLGSEPVPVLRKNQSRMILNDTESGWVWTLPDGALVPSSQDWSIAAVSNDDTTEEEQQAVIVSERKPPVAEDDQFGVRAGQLVSLPVLLNDHDPNEDVLTIDPASVTQPDSSFGVISVTNNAQDLAIQVAPGASGSASFQYAVTDGTQSDGLLSELATVTLTVYGDDVNNPPVWCGVLDCNREWPVLQVQPGSSASAEVLRGWVDPEGDPIYLQSATNTGEVGTVATTPDGTLLFQHPDPSLPGGTNEVTVRVADIRGAVAEKTLVVEVTATPSMAVEAFAISATAGEPIVVNPSKYITGVAGAYFVQSAKTENEDGSSTVVDNGGRSFTFAAPAAGNYFVSYTVRDDLTEVIGTVRIQVLSAESQQLSASPITVFVRPKADATIDVFPSVTNPSNKVLLLTEALPSPLNGSSLDVAVVNQQLLRVKGSTADGQAGVLGTVRYTVSDGTGNALATAHGEATVILLPAAAAQAPVAVPDAVTVRAGAQVDIPVLDNDLAPDGNTLILNPDVLAYEVDEGLAFISGSQLRLLAPETPGEYDATYTVYSAGSPEVSAQARVRITVIPAGENRAPEPRTLVGRVLAGSTVSIPFDSFGIDPDGDTVVLDRIVSQPESGSATIAATGDAIVYTSVPGFAGPVQFEYRVTDQYGESGTAAVRVGVIDQQSNPSPITYSDYVEVQQGKANTVSVQPAANDIDPAGKKLEVTDVVPDAVAGTAEYDELAALIGLTEDGIVTLTAGEILGTRSFFYTVTNSTGDSSIGLIVMKVVRESVPDHPRVADTYLTVDDRGSFSSGIDVVTGKVTWNSGDISDLELSLWGEQSGYSVNGWKIAGSLPEKSALVPFVLTGTNVLGTEVSTYGFLRIPGKNDVILALKSGTPPQRVDESKSATFDLAELVSVPSGERLEIDQKNIKTAGKRADATCTADGTKITYTAGAGNPWVDYCAIPARLAGQSDYATLIVPIEVIPEIPLPILRSAAITHSPAAPATTYDLLNMVEWAGKEDDASLTFAINYTGDQFSVVPDGNKLTVYALDNATPGRDNTVKVSLTSHPEVAAAVLSLKVGPAPSELPKGGTVTKVCAQSDASCSVKVIGIPGEVNVYRTALAVTSVSVPASCTGISMEVTDSSTIRATWTQDAPGGKCTASFVVKDPQGKLSPDERNGTFLLDFQGYPKAPSSVIQSKYDDGMVKLSVNPGASTSAYPSLIDFEIYHNGNFVTNCDTSGVCKDINGLTNGTEMNYDVYARNSVGKSVAKVSTVAWAYARPDVGAVTLTPDYTTSTTNNDGHVTARIVSTDTAVASYSITGKSTPVPRNSSGTTEIPLNFPVGPKTISVSAISTIPVPTNGTGPQSDVYIETVNVAGTPKINSAGSAGSGGSDSIKVDGTSFGANYGDSTMKLWYIASTGSATCVADSSTGDYSAAPTFTGSGNAVETTSGSGSVTIGGLTQWTVYNVVVCAWNGFGVTKTASVQAVPYNQGSIEVPAGYTYLVSDGASNGQFIVQRPTSPNSVPSGYVEKFTNWTSGSGATLSGEAPNISVQFCRSVLFVGEVCGTSATVAAGSASLWQVRTTSTPAPVCTASTGSVQVAASGTPTPGAAVTTFQYYSVDDDDWLDGTPGTPFAGTQVRNIHANLTWSGTDYVYGWDSPSGVEYTCNP